MRCERKTQVTEKLVRSQNAVLYVAFTIVFDQWHGIIDGSEPITRRRMKRWRLNDPKIF